MHKISLSLVLLFCWSFISTQSLDPFVCEVYEEGRNLIHPFVGGLDNPQTYKIDVNNDGLEDLVILDRDGDVIIPYLADVSSGSLIWDYAPEYKSSFDNVREWMVLRDFNQDGVMDLFGFPQSNFFGIEVRRGFYQNDTIQFESLVFNEISGITDIIPIPSTNGFFTNLFVASNDQPEIIDVDGDGDMDVLTFDVGGAYIQYYRNYALEKGLGLDTFSMELEDLCWGKFFELETNQELLLSTDPDVCATLFTDDDEEIATNRHAGSCVTVFDNDGDGDLDLLLGDLSSSQMTMVTNGGTSPEAWMTEQDVNFPSYDIPIDVDVFNAGFYVDVNNDGRRDLVVSPNAVSASVENHRVMWHYENIGTDDDPNFNFQSDLLFVDDMLDFGSGSSPTFVDANQDGLMDIVVGSRGRYMGIGETEASMNLLLNQGTLDTPIFELVDDDYAGYRQFMAESAEFNPSFGDLDGDGDIDMIVGDNNGFLFYSENIAGPGLPFEFAPAIYQYANIQPGNIVRPQIVDLNGDGLSDLVLGERRNNSDGNGGIGALIYYPNIGEIGNPQFEEDEEASPNIVAFGKVNTQTIFEISASTAPYFYNDGEKTYLFTGSKNGAIHIYDDIDNNLEGTFNQITDNFGSLNEGESTTVAVYDIDNDNRLEMVLGNERGGLSFFNTGMVADVSVSTSTPDIENELSIYPNPSNSIFKVNNEKSLNYQIYNTEGLRIAQDRLSVNGEINLSAQPSGVYFLQLEGESRSEWLKMIKI